MPTSQANVQLYSCADESAQNAIINTYPNFFTTNPDKLLAITETLVTQKSNPMVHRMTFHHPKYSIVEIGHNTEKIREGCDARKIKDTRNIKRLKEKHTYSSNRNKIQVSLVKQ